MLRIPPTIPEPSVPSHEQLDEYQEWVLKLLQNDLKNGGRLNKSGLHPIIYCCNGILEETEELTENSDEGYNRLAALLRLEQTTEASQTDLIRHQKEFGDTIWYAAGALGLLGVKLSDCLDTAITRTPTIPSILGGFDISPGVDLINSVDYLRRSAESFFRRCPVVISKKGENPIIITDHLEARALNFLVHRDERVTPRINLTRSTGQFIIASSKILEINFRTTLRDVSIQNQEKIARRTIDGTVEKNDGVGGDDR